MVASYREQRLRQTILREASAVAVLSDHMRRECILQSVDAALVRQLPVFVPGRQDRVAGHAACGADEGVHIIFVGRMERLKGAHVLLSALEQVAPAMLRDVRVTIVGDGRERHRCEQQAVRLGAGGPRIEFTGWLSHEGCAELVRTADLLAVPSVWPEPLGLVGLEASAAGVAAVAFDVGGVREWLTDNVTGRIVPGAPSETGLARALEDCLRDRERLRRWGTAAADRVRPRTVAAHVNALEELLSGAAGIAFHRDRVVETGTYA
jgi:glycosyltransferase involved in cell wall biosynthesis